MHAELIARFRTAATRCSDAVVPCTTAVMGFAIFYDAKLTTLRRLQRLSAREIAPTSGVRGQDEVFGAKIHGGGCHQYENAASPESGVPDNTL